MRFEFELTGLTPCLFHADDVMQADSLEAWRKHPDNKNKSKAGDDRSPAWTWITYLYSDGEKLVIPTDNLMVALRTGASKITMKRQETFKRVSQSGLFIDSDWCDFEGPKGPVQMADIDKLKALPFPEQAERVKDLGFTLFLKRGVIGKAKHIRVRARFEEWKLRGRIEIIDDIITEERLRDFFRIAGSHAGLLDWRPSSPTSPGRFGKFESKLKKIK